MICDNDVTGERRSGFAPAILKGARADRPGSLFMPGVGSGDPHAKSCHRWQTPIAPWARRRTGPSRSSGAHPKNGMAVETDAGIEIASGFNVPGSGKRLQTSFARTPPAQPPLMRRGGPAM